MTYAEQDMQMKFITYLQWRKIPFNHSPNEGKRTPQEGNKLKRMGMSKGFPDLEIPLPCNGKHGLYIEFKTASGKVSPEQQAWLDRLNKSGYVAQVARSYAEAEKILERYLKNNEVDKVSD